MAVESRVGSRTSVDAQVPQLVAAAHPARAGARRRNHGAALEFCRDGPVAAQR